MPTTYLVDAYNVLFRALEEVPEDREAARRLLVRRVAAALRGRGGGDRARLVFDTRSGSGLAGARGGAGTVSWEHVVGSADDAICEWVRHRPAGEVVVVTDDRELAGRARQLGARSQGVAAFLGSARPSPPVGREAAPAPPTGPPLRPEDFGLPSGPIDLGEVDPEAL